VLEVVLVAHAGLLDDHLRVEDHVAAEHEQPAVLEEEGDNIGFSRVSNSPAASRTHTTMHTRRLTRLADMSTDERKKRLTRFSTSSADSIEPRIPPMNRYERRVAVI
jgi:hypothetical protein